MVFEAHSIFIAYYGGRAVLKAEFFCSPLILGVEVSIKSIRQLETHSKSMRLSPWTSGRRRIFQSI